MSLIATNSYTKFFLHVLSTPAGSLPKGAQWVVAFDDLNNRIVKKGITTALGQENRKWAIDQAANVITSDPYQKNSGCIFCQAIDLPGEGTGVVQEGNIQTNAFLRSYVGTGRDQFPEMRVTFLDTNVSFVDNVCRPWSIATASFGLIAQPSYSEKNYRTNMYCWKLAAFEPKQPPTVTMSMTFYDICCVGVSNEEYNYQSITTPVTREARFIYNFYSVNTQHSSNFLDNRAPDVEDPLLLDKQKAQDSALRLSEQGTVTQ
jgi:hypothetical protein